MRVAQNWFNEKNKINLIALKNHKIIIIINSIHVKAQQNEGKFVPVANELFSTSFSDIFILIFSQRKMNVLKLIS